MNSIIPICIGNIAQLEDLLSEPTERTVQALRACPGDILILGAGGKMGPTLARMARRAADLEGAPRRVIAVSRFSSPSAAEGLRACGVETITADLLDPSALSALPDAPNVIYMVGQKFGTSGNPSFTWAMNVFLPGLVGARFAGCRIAAFSSGNVYPMTSTTLGGSVETDVPSPVGEYAISALGRERMFEHAALAHGAKVVLIRLNYAVETRYGVLADIARKVWTGEAIDLTMGAVNVIWQGDANALSICALEEASSPATIVNIAGPEQLSVRRVATQFGELLGREPVFSGVERDFALLNNGQKAHARYGYPRVPVGRVIEWVAEWIRAGGADLGKPTHFETTDGKF